MDRQILWDCHMHSSFSADSDTPMEVMIHRAVETGLPSMKEVLSHINDMQRIIYCRIQ